MPSQEIKLKKRLGQVFLKNRKYVEKIVSALDILPKELIIEIGPGSGILTEALLKTKARIISIEKDPFFCKLLEEKFKNYNNLHIIQADIRDILISKLQMQNSKNILNSKIQLGGSNYKLTGNIPYYLTSYLFRLLINLEKKPKLIVLMVQKEVALRIVAKPPKMNLLAALIQAFFKPEIVCYVSKNSFWPKPKVDSAIIKMTPLRPFYKNKKEKEKFIRMIKIGFSQPRKLFINNLFEVLQIKKEILESLLKKFNLQLNVRPQELSLNQWFSIWQTVKKYIIIKK